MGMSRQAGTASSWRQGATVVTLGAVSLAVSLRLVDLAMRHHYYEGLAAERPGDGPGPAAPEDSAVVAG